MKEGRGKMNYGKGVSYEGEWRQNQYYGKGLLVEEDGSIHEGDFVQNYKHGEG